MNSKTAVTKANISSDKKKKYIYIIFSLPFLKKLLRIIIIFLSGSLSFISIHAFIRA